MSNNFPRGLRSGTRLSEPLGWVLILLLAAGIRFYRLDWAALWYDEAYSMVMSTHPPARIWSLSGADVHPPLYYYCLRAWIGLFGSELVSMRALSAWTGVIAVGLGMWLTRLLATRRATLFAGIFLALLPIAIRYSHEMRMYTLLSVWMTGATIGLVYWVGRPERRLCLAAYSVLVAAGLYTHYFAMVGVMTHWLYLLTLPKASNGRRPVLQPAWWMANLVTALLFLPWLPVLVGQLAHSSTLGWIKPVTLYSIPSALWQYLILQNATALPAPLYWGLPLALLIICAYCLARDQQPQRFGRLLVIYFWAPLLVMWVVSLQFSLFVPRYFLFSALALPVLLGLSLDHLMRDHRWLAVVGFVVVVGVEATGIRNLYGEYDYTNADGRPTQERIDAIATLINQQYQPGDQIILLNYYWYSSLVYYNKSAAKPLLYVPAPRADGAVCMIYCPFTTPYDAQGIDFYIERLDALPPDTTRVWLVDGSDASDQLLSLPCRWRLEDVQIRGDNRVRLYEVDAALDSLSGKSCPPH